MPKNTNYLGYLRYKHLIQPPYLVIIVDSGLLVLLVLGDQVVHVGLSLSELHLVHALASVPMEESLGNILNQNVQSSFEINPTFRLNMAPNWSEILWKSVWMAVVLPMKVEAMLIPLGGMSHTAVLMLLGIHSTK